MEAGNLTADSTYANFPVISGVKDNKTLVAYKRRAGNRSEVVVSLLSMP
ncbi:hypothetical protein AB6805_10290 [Chitinophaga sp. RCC_12]